ncbi:MAG: hypothetical protein N2C14_07660 [Planctomycetales bacterium]
MQPLEENPYRSPQSKSGSGSPYSRDELEDRVRELERLVESSWFLSSNPLVRVAATFGHFFLGYFLLILAMMPIIALLSAFG